MAKVFLVTGSARGLGRDIAEAVLAAGHQLLATARNPERLADLVSKYGDAIHPVALDVTDPKAAEAAVHAAVDTFGRLDVVINNAGYANLVSVEDITAADFRAQVETNLFGVVNVAKAAVPILRAQGSGHIVNVSSVGGRVATPGLSAYQTAKWAVGGFSEVLAAELAPLGIKVTALEPGGMRTDWAGSSMTVPPISQPYQGSVGVIANVLGSGAAEAGDPAKVAQAILTLVELDEPPVRLLLGSDAITVAEAAAKAQVESDARWRSLTVSTDHDDVTAQQLDPLNTRS
jgi:NAD(P)-dependent dehydrogenase (short-subunit alcohol dehydrogenase family)